MAASQAPLKKGVTIVPAGTADANVMNIGAAQERIEKLNMIEAAADAKSQDPRYSTAAQQSALKTIKDDTVKARGVLAAELDIRQRLALALQPPGDGKAAAAALAELQQHRQSTYPKYYTKGAKVGNPCMDCLEQHLAKVKAAIVLSDARQAADAITGVFEGGRYCALADNPNDLGKLSYGKHQASETSGHLRDMVKKYSDAQDPKPDPELKKRVDAHLARFDAKGKSYLGSAKERAEFRSVLRDACQDPAMQKVQDDFFWEEFGVAAFDQANGYGAQSALGKAMYYDMGIQGPGLIPGFSNRALLAWSKAHKVVPPATACKPTDPNGPDEKAFLLLVNAQRRAAMTNSSNALYRATTYRPDEFDRLLNSDNLDLTKDFVLRDQPFKGIPTSPAAP